MDPNWHIKFLIVAPGGIKTNFGTNIQFGNRHSAYDTPDGPFNQLMKYMMNPNLQETFSDSAKCAQVLFDAVLRQDERALPARLLMGGETIGLIEGESEKSAGELIAWREETMSCSPSGGVKDLPNF